MRREQKTEQSGYCRESMLETEGNGGVRSAVSLESADGNSATALLERVLSRNNLNLAYKRVKRNGGAAGIDGMTVDEMLPYLQGNRDELLESILGGWYKLH